MDFNFTEEQQMLRASLRRFLEERYAFEKRTAASRVGNGLVPGIWQAFARELGILGAGLPEGQGGFGGGPVEHMIIMEELGRALVLEPYLETIVIGAHLLSRREGKSAARMLEEVLSGDHLLAYAWAERGMTMDLFKMATKAVRDDNGWRLSGHKSIVTAAPWASHLLIPARTSTSEDGNAGISLFLVNKTQAGVKLRDYTTIDGRRASDVELENVALSDDALLFDETEALPLLEEISNRAVAALCAEAIGIMNHLLEATISYTKERKQFGKEIASFQVLQHRMADMRIEIELATSAVYLATLKIDAPHNIITLAASTAKVIVAAASQFVGQNAVQLHGAMGMTDELEIGHYFKRLMAISADFGDEDYHSARHRSLSLIPNSNLSIKPVAAN